MPTGIREYILWRGDVPFSVDPFGETDALVLAELSYIPFEGILANGWNDTLPHELTLREAARLFDKNSVEERLRIYTFELDAELLALAGDSERFGDITVGEYTSLLAPEKEQQFAAVTFTLADERRFIAFRGTDATLVGWKEDFNFSFMTETPAQRLAAEYLKAHAGKDCPIMLGGHSKGGNLAVYAAAKCSDEIFGRIEKIYTFDSPGFRPETMQSGGFERVKPVVSSVIPESSLVGQLLAGSTSRVHTIVKSSETGFLQHNAYSWEIQRNRFVRAGELSELGKFIERTMTGWLTEMNDEDRRMFTKALFDMIESSDAETVSELGKSKLKSSAAILKATSRLKPEQQKAMRHALAELARSGTRALWALAGKNRQKQALPDNTDGTETV